MLVISQSVASLSLKMAASMKCCIHVCPDEKSPICTISLKNYLKICERIQEWISLDGTEQEIALLLSQESGGCPEHDLVFTGTSECMNCSTCSVYLSSLGYHAKCYSRFTDKTKVERAKNRLKNVQQTSTPKASGKDAAATERPMLRSDRPMSSPRILYSGPTPSKSVVNRSSSESVSGTVASSERLACTVPVDHRRRLGLFPVECCICHGNKYTKVKHSHKRLAEKLLQCLTYAAAEKLQQAAQVKNDEQLLVQVRDTDLVAKEAHYHIQGKVRFPSKGQVKNPAGHLNIGSHSTDSASMSSRQGLLLGARF